MRPPKIVAYLSHPLTDEDIARRQDNLAGAFDWFRFLVEATPWAILAPWLPYVQVLSPIQRDRGLADNRAAIERADLFVVTGGRVSVRMSDERDHAAGCGLPIVDLVSWGEVAPPSGDATSLAALQLRTRHAINGRPRRVWLPPLERDEIGELKGNRSVLRAHHGEVDIAVLSSIIEAAEAIQP